MDGLLNSLKGQVTTLNILVILFTAAFVLFRLGKRKSAIIFSAITLLGFILTSTAYLPYYLVGRMESKYRPFSVLNFPSQNEAVFVHVLGGGYTSDGRLPAQAQLSTYSLGRLAEGLRICNSLENTTLIFSGHVVSGDRSMASVMKDAAISLDADPSKIELLEQAGTTKEEALQFAERYGRDIILIVVTDAVHMPRAMRFFEEEGVKAYPAPTNFLVKSDDGRYSLRWIPSAENLLLMDRVLREALGSLKGSILN